MMPTHALNKNVANGHAKVEREKAMNLNNI